MGTAGDLLPFRRCLTFFSFSPFLVKGPGRGVCKVQDRWHWEGKEREPELKQQQEHDVNRDDGFASATLRQNSYKRQVLVILQQMCLFLDKLQWMLLSLYMSSSLYFVRKATMHYIIDTGMKSSAIGLC